MKKRDLLAEGRAFEERRRDRLRESAGGRSHSEIANALGINKSKVTRTLKRGGHRLTLGMSYALTELFRT